MAVLVAFACSNDPAAPLVEQLEQLGQDAATYWPGTTWRSATPAEVGVDGPALASLVSRLRTGALGAEHAVVVVRRGM